MPSFLPPPYGCEVLPRVAGLRAIYPGLFPVSPNYGDAGNDFGHPSFHMHKDVCRVVPWGGVGVIARPQHPWAAVL